MTLDALKHRNITKVDRMLERFVCFMTGVTPAISQSAKIHWMLKRPRFGVHFRLSRRVIQNAVADVAIVPDHFTRIAHMLAIVTTETTG
jgi:hypothetical protein